MKKVAFFDAKPYGITPDEMEAFLPAPPLKRQLPLCWRRAACDGRRRGRCRAERRIQRGSPGWVHLSDSDTRHELQFPRLLRRAPQRTRFAPDNCCIVHTLHTPHAPIRPSHTTYRPERSYPGAAGLSGRISCLSLSSRFFTSGIGFVPLDCIIRPNFFQQLPIHDNIPGHACDDFGGGNDAVVG